MSNVLYISYDGMTDALGQSQVLNYLKRLSGRHSIYLLSFEKSTVSAETKRRVAREIADADITWIPLSYTKKPPIFSTVKDILKGIRTARSIIRENGIRIIHVRGHIAGLIGLGVHGQKTSLLFDLRGWLPDEMRESGRWPDVGIYRSIYTYFKKKEKQLIEKSSVCISLTQNGASYLVDNFAIKRDSIRIIPTCVDEECFQLLTPDEWSSMRLELGFGEGCKVMLYSGALGGNYPVPWLVNAYRVFKAEYGATRLLVLSKDGRGSLAEQFVGLGLDQEEFIILQADFKDVHHYLNVADLGVIFYKKGFSNIGRSPTKLGEYWACGLPFMINAGIGDVDEICADHPWAGVVVDFENEESMKSALLNSQKTEKSRLRGMALDKFSLEKGVATYADIYEQLEK